MSKPVFAPQSTVEHTADTSAEAPPQNTTSTASSGDATGSLLLRLAQYAVVGLLGLLPVFFTPGAWASLGFDKTLLALVVAGFGLVVLSLVALRRREVTTTLPVAIPVFWAVVLTALLSGLLSGDLQDTVQGSTMEPQTTGFLAVLGVLMVLPLIFQGAGLMTVRALGLFAAGLTLLLLYTLVRVVGGPGFLDLGTFGSVTSTPLGGLNDLGVLAALFVLLILITLAQLPLRRVAKGVCLGVLLLALVVLAIVNVFNLWLIVGFFGLLLLLYLISRDTMFRSGATEAPAAVSKSLLAAAALVCVVSALFIVAGQYVGGQISQLTGVDYLEVRPSFDATLGVAREVYGSNVLLGNGPNRFADAWRLYKDPSINQTVFWDSDFPAGSGFVPTLFVNLGVLGGTLLVLFHALVLWVGYRMLVRHPHTTSIWYYVGLIAFTSTVFLWGMSYIYVPGTTLLLLAALFTGLTFAAYGSLVPAQQRTIPLVTSRQRGFLLMAVAIVVITGTVGAVFQVGEQYVAQASFNQARASAESPEALDRAAAAAYQLYPDDRFLSARAQLAQAQLASILNQAEPSSAEQQQFVSGAERALTFAERAVAADPTNPDHHALMATIYNTLALAGVEGAPERVANALERARSYDQQNPGYDLLEARVAARTDDLATARAEIQQALELKRNFTPALYLSAQLDVAAGNVESAIATTRSIITLEPNNPTRYFQLGVLLTAAEETESAIAAFRAAIARDPNYANARYLLALAYLRQNDSAAALTELRRVQQSNQENQQLATLIERLESGEAVTPPELGLDTPVSETSAGEATSESIITDEALDSDLVAPVNTVPGDDSAGASATTTLQATGTPPVVTPPATSSTTTPAGE